MSTKCHETLCTHITMPKKKKIKECVKISPISYQEDKGKKSIGTGKATGFRSNKIPKTTLSKTFGENYYRQFRPRRLKKYENSRLASYEFHNDGLAKCFTENDKNCFALGGFLTPVDVNPIENAESDHFVPPENWSTLSDATAFEEFMQCDSELATYSLLTIDEMIANEEISSQEEDNCTEKPLPSFQQALAPCKNTSLAVI
ncbi:hypothetical protein AVEN_229974-1 [Araneus ventricosus]|uniref:Uncharacterized protein n=1 Tax=Araneus ventricosus TaxID=182803 RepID=A0A4Y2BX88_ARAVE|nr:hypothetical protein AVEN_229974-1 [Araneus ventricosus]